MTDLRASVRRLCDLASSLDGTEHHHDFIVECRALATSPLLVLDALRDPEVRAGTKRIEFRRGVDGVFRVQVRVLACAVLQRWSAGLGEFGPWVGEQLDVVDLDAPCRLVPAEGGRARAVPMTLFECRTCSRTTEGEARPDGFAVAGWSAIDGIDGPNGICPECAADPTSLDSLREDGYPDARVRAIAEGR